jgi:hypothetical protein
MTYLYEQLSPEKFQHLCQALISAEFPNTQCLPVAQPDGGRDAVTWLERAASLSQSETIVFQVKFSRSAERAGTDFLDEIVEQELPKIEKLKKKGMKAYYLITNVRGTAHFETGAIDRIHSTLSAALGIPAYCWWRDDLDRRIDSKSDVKWSYPEIIRGSDLLQALLSGTLGEDGKRRDSAVQAYLVEQYSEDREVKFKQVDLFNNLLDLFVDTNISSVGVDYTFARFESTPFVEDRNFYQYHERHSVSAASSFLGLNEDSNRIVLEGAPGQGKSTISQYICQVHRIRLLDKTYDRAKVPDQYFSSTLRIPMRVDLRDFATWLSGRNPFSSDPDSSRPAEMPASLEGFLAFQISQGSGGHLFTVTDLSSIARESHLLIVLDGFDEVADISLRELVVREVSRAANRLENSSKSLLTVVTSRPAAFAKSPGFPRKDWKHFTLLSMTAEQINAYADKWMSIRQLPPTEKEKFKQVLREKLQEVHMRDLARNPMQLAILLNLIQTKGLSLPDKRTHLYDSYVDLFFSREAEKSLIVRDHRDLLIELHRYLAWVLQTDAEGKRSPGSVTEERLKALLQNYLVQQGHQTTIVDDLFTGMTERVVALVSRVQGTFEFEVQPLREYFAARHLYETAPYSPPGREKPGTKPERFDALARNFYWLNVTRFYCGCYSHGELSSLADGLIELAGVEGFKEISYSRLLITMLLSDWVFTQQPNVIKRLVLHLTSQPGFKALLARSISDGTTIGLVPPERCGRQDILSAVASWFSSGVQTDVCIGLAVALRSSVPFEACSRLWKELQPKAGSEDNWYLFGRMLGVFTELSYAEALPLFEAQPALALSNFFFARRYDILEANPKLLDETIRIITTGKAKSSSPHLEENSSIIANLAFALDPNNYSILFERDFGERLASTPYYSLIRQARRRREKGEQSPPSVPNFVTAAYDSTRRFTTEVSEAMNAVASEWAFSLRPWSAVVESGMKEWGMVAPLVDIALLSAGISSKDERGQFGDDIDDPIIPLCQSLRFARLKSGAPNWWLSQLSKTSNQELSLTTLLCWATARTTRQLAQHVAPLVDQLEQKSWSTLIDRIKRIAEISGASDGSIEGIETIQSDRLFLAIALRSPRDERDLQIFERFKGYVGTDVVIFTAVSEAALHLAERDSRKWNATLQVIKNAYLVDVQAYPLVGTRYYGEFDLPENIAKGICQSADSFPLALISAAQQSLQGSLAKKIGKPLGEIALEHNWFASAM